MTFELVHLFFAAVCYLLVLFLVAYAAEREYIPARIARHPATYVLSLGVYATSWSYYGSVGFAQNQGYNFLTIYLGVTLAFILAPVILRPILHLTREYQLTSLADLFAFRYRSHWAGVLVTLFMLAGALPYISLQIRAVTESIQILTQGTPPTLLALGFCLTLILFAILFGARHISPREKHEGLVVAIAFESAVKLIALLLVGLFALFGVFGGTGPLQAWLQAHPQALEALYDPVREGPWTTFLLLSFAAAFLLPRQFHMAFTENIEPRGLDKASWGFPLLLLLLNLPIPLILWAGQAIQAPTEADYYVLGITLTAQSSLLPVLAFVGGVSSASAMMIVTTLALAAMTLNHLILPATLSTPGRSHLNLYQRLLWGRRVLIAVIILAGFGFHLVLENNQGLVQLGLISFVAVAQFLPGVVGLLFWPHATRAGFISGLLGGAAVWVLTLIIPLAANSGLIGSDLGISHLRELSGQDHWSFATFWSLSINALLFFTVSLFTRPSEEEMEAARACCRRSINLPLGVVSAASSEQFKERLAWIMGEEAADREVSSALQDLGLSPQEHRSAELRRLRERIERNLSGLVGPLLARAIVDQRLQLAPGERIALADSLRFIEDRLADSRVRLEGMSAQLDSLRRYHSDILQELPLAVCSLGPDGEVVIWNLAMTVLSGIPKHEAIGSRLEALDAPWNELLSRFVRTRDQHLYKVELEINGQPRWMNLHKAVLESSLEQDDEPLAGTVILLEDLSELHTLEVELAHSERLASIGRLAAGVAHEIGNPLTGINSISQNLKYETEPEVIQEGIQMILEQTRRITDIVQSLLTFTHGGQVSHGHFESIHICQCVDEAVRLVQLSHKAKQVDCVNTCPTGLQVQGDPQRLIQVFVNLLVNARDASKPGDTVEIQATRDGGQLRIDVIDQGEGIPEDLHERIFEPFYTSKQPGEGTGLGLPLVYSIIRDHGGDITLESEPGKGTRFSVFLPLQSSNPAPK